MCQHNPRCPDADSPNRDQAQLVAQAVSQGWGRRCNGLLIFDDTGELLPDGQIIAPHRPLPKLAGAA
ncbi:MULTISPECIES: DUF5999 family protein [Streptomyces]|uniref:DUF5999 family protein n=1 Tax=Streptomyces TaxID=1883 RepID=UPI00225BAF65|nr:DUF5999 family protein [Streptomyces virginiae]MCX5275422.1 DUF5999 family protein [Streptomyces virginiae]